MDTIRRNEWNALEIRSNVTLRAIGFANAEAVRRALSRTGSRIVAPMKRVEVID